MPSALTRTHSRPRNPRPGRASGKRWNSGGRLPLTLDVLQATAIIAVLVASWFAWSTLSEKLAAVFLAEKTAKDTLQLVLLLLFLPAAMVVAGWAVRGLAWLQQPYSAEGMPIFERFIHPCCVNHSCTTNGGKRHAVELFV